MSGIIIAMPENERQEFIKAMETVEGRAEAFTDECIKILVEEYSAAEAEIKRDIFYLSAIYHLVSGYPLPKLEAAVREAIGLYKPKYLGLEAD